MIDFKLALELKDAGFPQHEFEKHNKDCLNRVNMDVCFPTLSELIKECVKLLGRCSFTLQYNAPIETWQTFNKESFVFDGESPEEAMVKLFINLNKK